MDRFTMSELAPSQLFKALMLVLIGLAVAVSSINSAHSAWFEDLMPKDDTYKVKDVDGDEVFVIDDYIYDARQTCYLSVGDRVVFSEGQYGIDYQATIYDMDSQQHCELLLRDPVS